MSSLITLPPPYACAWIGTSSRSGPTHTASHHVKYDRPAGLTSLAYLLTSSLPLQCTYDVADRRANWAQVGGSKNEQDIDMMMDYLRNHG